MEETTRQIASIKNGTYLKGLRSTARFSQEVYELVEEDLNYGLSSDQTDLYLKKEFKFSQMKVISGFLRKGIAQEFIEKMVAHENLNGYQMQVALEFYQKGISLSVIEETIEKDSTPSTMKKMFEAVLANTKAAVKEVEAAPEYVQELLIQMTDVVGKIQFQEQRYDELNKKLTIFETTKMDEEVRDGLLKKLADTEAELGSQQDKINSASATIARLREQIGQKDKEMSRMQNRIDTLETKLLEKADAPASAPASAASQAVPEEKEAQPTILDKDFGNDSFSRNRYGIPIYFQMPVTDAHGRIVQHVPVERTQRKSDTGIAAMIGRLCFKKKSRQNIVKLVASGDLVPAQLIQIKSGMEKGLTEGQLVELITNNVSAEKMKEIIEIAVFENSMND